MIENFTKSLGFLGVDATNMNYQACEKNMYKFEDENIDKYWRCFYAFYRTGRNDLANELAAFAVKCIQK